MWVPHGSVHSEVAANALRSCVWLAIHCALLLANGSDIIGSASRETRLERSSGHQKQALTREKTHARQIKTVPSLLSVPEASKTQSAQLRRQTNQAQQKLCPMKSFAASNRL